MEISNKKAYLYNSEMYVIFQFGLPYLYLSSGNSSLIFQPF